MAFFHGVKGREVPTSIIAPAQTTAGLPVVFGTAPVHLTDDPTAYVNKPVICYSWTEAENALGYSDDWDKYTLCEAMYSEFKLYAIKPIIFVNVLNPAVHKTVVSGTSKDLASDKTVTLNEPVILSTLKVKASSEATADAVLNTDYTAAYDDDGKLVISVLEDGALAENTSIVLSYDKVDPTAVTANHLIGGSDLNGNPTGLELIDSIFTLFAMVPGMVVAPGWSENPVVAAVMKAKCSNISEVFRCICITDVDTAQVTKYSDVNVWKNNNNYTGNNQLVCWPCVRMGDMIFHKSTHVMGGMGVTDASNDDIPYQSPSNQPLQATGLCLKDGTEVTLTLSQANLLNSQGIITGLNFTGGWKIWGNYTGAYPSITDVKDSFICARRMFDWQYQTFILTYWQKIDAPIVRRLAKTIVDSENIRLNGLVTQGYLLGADVKFLEEE
ncbi:MAG: phage tail sheath family protein, partial [Anaerovibrio sp.]|nr:phage tail sheath family protein [Anaerovibrio sp.]